MGGNLPYHQRSQQQPPALQSTDFPPLSSAAEKKTPVAAGAWTNASTTRSVLRAAPPVAASLPAAGSALVHYPNVNASPNVGNGRGPSPNNGRLEDGFERPPSKGAAELFNPKAGRAQAANGNDAAGDAVTGPDALAEQVEGLSLTANGDELGLTASPTPEAASTEA